jgi:hypothetical protein
VCGRIVERNQRFTCFLGNQVVEQPRVGEGAGSPEFDERARRHDLDELRVTVSARFAGDVVDHGLKERVHGFLFATAGVSGEGERADVERGPHVRTPEHGVESDSGRIVNAARFFIFDDN